MDMADMDRWKTVEWAMLSTFVHLVRMNGLESFVVCIVGKMEQDVGKCCDVIPI